MYTIMHTVVSHVYVCAVISLCGQRQELRKALKLVADMRGLGVMPNIHTYPALMLL